MSAGLFAGPCLCTVAICLSGEPTQAEPAPDARFELRRIPGKGHDALLLMHADANSSAHAADYLSAHLSGGRVCYSPLCRNWHDLPDAYESLLKHLPALRRLDLPSVIAWDDSRLEAPAESPFGEDALRELSESLRSQSASDLRFAASLLSACLGQDERPLSAMRMLTLDALHMICTYLDGREQLSSAALERMNPLAQGRLDDARRMKSLLSSAVEIALSSFPKVDPSCRSELTQDVLLYIEEHLLEPSFSIYTISAAFGLSESAFSHLFKRTFHETFSSYVSKQKLIHAFDLLCDESITLEEVALRLGYSRASNFGRMFKAEVGMSPGKYRSLHAKGEKLSVGASH